MKITDEMIRKALTSLNVHLELDWFDQRAMDIVLRSVAPLIIEECAKVCDDEEERLPWSERWDPWEVRVDTLKYAAAAIRALKEDV